MDAKALFTFSNTKIEFFLLHCEELVYALPNSETDHSKCHCQTLPSWCHLTLGTQLWCELGRQINHAKQLGYE